MPRGIILCILYILVQSSFSTFRGESLPHEQHRGITAAVPTLEFHGIRHRRLPD